MFAAPHSTMSQGKQECFILNLYLTELWDENLCGSVWTSVSIRGLGEYSGSSPASILISCLIMCIVYFWIPGSCSTWP